MKVSFYPLNRVLLLHHIFLPFVKYTPSRWAPACKPHPEQERKATPYQKRALGNKNQVKIVLIISFLSMSSWLVQDLFLRQILDAFASFTYQNDSALF
ncbi:hypothetical protein A3J21_01600 [Candidatus Daviesbacteria bacterium RIFCSPLOWO2_02_FULL_43_11]|nr:MAG: hypothetical protein A3J21_01600 [Candidatus Daviesbacteria bacterium RIFCSPLOWO2_02_FULL_43_11]